MAENMKTTHFWTVSDNFSKEAVVDFISKFPHSDYYIEITNVINGAKYDTNCNYEDIPFYIKQLCEIENTIVDYIGENFTKGCYQIGIEFHNNIINSENIKNIKYQTKGELYA